MLITKQSASWRPLKASLGLKTPVDAGSLEISSAFTRVVFKSARTVVSSRFSFFFFPFSCSHFRWTLFYLVSIQPLAPRSSLCAVSRLSYLAWPVQLCLLHLFKQKGLQRFLQCLSYARETLHISFLSDQTPLMFRVGSTLMYGQSLKITVGC